MHSSPSSFRSYVGSLLSRSPRTAGYHRSSSNDGADTMGAKPHPRALGVPLGITCPGSPNQTFCMNEGVRTKGAARLTALLVGSLGGYFNHPTTSTPSSLLRGDVSRFRSSSTVFMPNSLRNDGREGFRLRSAVGGTSNIHTGAMAPHPTNSTLPSRAL